MTISLDNHGKNPNRSRYIPIFVPIVMFRGISSTQWVDGHGMGEPPLVPTSPNYPPNKYLQVTHKYVSDGL